jgi:hypothetical protein
MTREREERGTGRPAEVRQAQRGRGGRERHLPTIDKRERGERVRQAGRGEAGTEREGGEDGSDTYQLLTRERER